jgi:hypothetical protein
MPHFADEGHPSTSSQSRSVGVSQTQTFLFHDLLLTVRLKFGTFLKKGGCHKNPELFTVAQVICRLRDQL